MRDGRTLKRHVLVNSGAGERALTTKEVVAKFMAHATMKASAAQAEQVCEAVLNLIITNPFPRLQVRRGPSCLKAVV